jgi:hypothetical protein
MLIEDQGASVRTNETEGAAISSRRGMELDMESLATSCTEPKDRETFPQIASGVAGNATAAATPGHNSRLSDEERIRLARIRKDRRLGWMPSFNDVEFLLDLIARFE